MLMLAWLGCVSALDVCEMFTAVCARMNKSVWQMQSTSHQLLLFTFSDDLSDQGQPWEKSIHSGRHQLPTMLLAY